MIERHLTFDVLADQTDAFERFFAESYAPTMAKAPGFVRVELLREIDSATRYVMALRWEDGDSALAWRTADAHTALQPAAQRHAHGDGGPGLRRHRLIRVRAPDNRPMSVDGHRVSHPRAWIEIDLDALAHNARVFRRAIPPGVRLGILVKANGYGHGMLLAAQAAVAGGADQLMVVSIDEALGLRGAGITAPILVVYPIDPVDVDVAVHADLEVSVSGTDSARRLLEAWGARSGHLAGDVLHVHVEVDSGMGRGGARPDDLPAIVASLDAIAGRRARRHLVAPGRWRRSGAIRGAGAGVRGRPRVRGRDGSCAAAAPHRGDRRGLRRDRPGLRPRPHRAGLLRGARPGRGADTGPGRARRGAASGDDGPRPSDPPGMGAGGDAHRVRQRVDHPASVPHRDACRSGMPTAGPVATGRAPWRSSTANACRSSGGCRWMRSAPT